MFVPLSKNQVKIVEYDKEYLHELYVEGRCKDKKLRFQPQVVAKYQKRIDTLMAATRKEDLFVLRSLNFEALHGDKEGVFSIRVDGQYRLEFALDEGGAEPMITIAIITELSNHYK